VRQNPPIIKGDEPMKADGLARSGDLIANAPAQDAVPAPVDSAVVTPNVRPLGGRRISFLAWGLAGIVGIAIWALIIRAL
jgi:hypothetical protein